MHADFSTGSPVGFVEICYTLSAASVLRGLKGRIGPHPGSGRMSLRQRTLVLAVLAAIASGAYGLALHYSPLIVYRVVEETLIQKAPDGITRSEIEKRLRSHLETATDGSSHLQKILVLSHHLEKTQKLRREDLERILGGGWIKPGEAER